MFPESTFIIIRDTDDNVFGVFTESVWRESTNYFGGSNCFLFRLNPSYSILYSTRPGTNYNYLNANRMDRPRGLGLGGPLGSCGFWLDADEYGKGYANPQSSDFEFGPLLDGETFVAETIQIWSAV
uniref:TLD domain-containing protein 1 n=2 Tax=Cacopsylla melanoneura TaxID=428564 RepID=A0A8D8XER7_9HEMI